jgi:CRP/FNR family transcriptional regulator, cyclic AMP receptor protein
MPTVNAHAFRKQLPGSKPPAHLERYWHLRSIQFFDLLTEAEIKELERESIFRTFERREFIYHPSEPGQCVYLVLRGRVKLKYLTQDGKESILGFVEVGELFGELTLFNQDVRQDYAEAAIESEIVAIPKAIMLEMMSRRTEVAVRITRLVGLRRQHVESRLRYLLFRSTRERLIHMLMHLVEQHGCIQGTKAEISFPLSHQDLAGLIGATRESVTTVLGELQSERLVRIQRRRLTLLNFRDWELLLQH